MQNDIQASAQGNRYIRENTERIHQAAPFRTGDTQNQPICAFAPRTDQDEGERLPIGHYVMNAHRNAVVMSQIADIFQIQQASMKGAQHKANGKRKSNSSWRETSQAVTRYDGDESKCTICQQDFVQGEYVTCLRCNKIFHEKVLE